MDAAWLIGGESHVGSLRVALKQNPAKKKRTKKEPQTTATREAKQADSRPNDTGQRESGERSEKMDEGGLCVPSTHNCYILYLLLLFVIGRLQQPGRLHSQTSWMLWLTPGCENAFH